jgi:hypothetical protein
MSQRAHAGGGDERVLARASAGYRQWFGDPKGDEALVGQAPDRGVDCAEGRWPTRAPFDLVFDGNGVRIVTKSLECGEDEYFEFAEEVTFGHDRLSTNAKI